MTPTTSAPSLTAQVTATRFRAGPASTRRVARVAVANLALLSGCSAHGYAFACGLTAGVLIGVVLSGVAMWVADAAWRGGK